MSDVTQLDPATFRSDVVEAGGVYAVRFWATWCGPCRMMEPIFKSLADELDGRAGFGEVDVDTAPEIAAAYGIRGVPTVLVFKDGAPVDQLVGLAPKSRYAAVLERQLAA